MYYNESKLIEINWNDLKYIKMNWNWSELKWIDAELHSAYECKYLPCNSLIWLNVDDDLKQSGFQLGIFEDSSRFQFINCLRIKR